MLPNWHIISDLNCENRHSGKSGTCRQHWSVVSSEKVTPKLVNGKWLIALFLFLIVLNHWVVLLIFPVKRAWSGIGLILDHRVVLLVFPVKRAWSGIGLIFHHGVVFLLLPIERTWTSVGFILHHWVVLLFLPVEGSRPSICCVFDHRVIFLVQSV